jgi:hypothetical protein
VPDLSVVPSGVIAHVAPSPGLQVPQLLGDLLESHPGVRAGRTQHGTRQPTHNVINEARGFNELRVSEQQAVRPRVVVLGIALRHIQARVQVTLHHVLMMPTNKHTQKQRVRSPCAVCPRRVRVCQTDLRKRRVGVAGEVMEEPPSMRPRLAALWML